MIQAAMSQSAMIRAICETVAETGANTAETGARIAGAGASGDA